MTSARGAICFSCARWGGPTCEAFPGGIPPEIMFGGFDHREQFSDEELLWELDPEEAESQAAYERIKDAMETEQVKTAVSDVTLDAAAGPSLEAR